jgi:excisionase family DNA binding protein
VDESGTRRVTVEEAARLLGIKEESVRKRVSRGKLRADKDEDGRLLVYVDSPGTVRDEYADQSVADRDELLASKDRIISILENQLEAEREARRRADTIIAQLTQANATLAARVPELEAAQEPSERAEEPVEGVAKIGHPPGDTGESRSSRKPWWRRVFGG